MHFGATVREILTASYGEDLRASSAGTSLPVQDSPATLKTLAANLELAFGIDLPAQDLAQLHTVRDVLQCVRLHRWEDRVTGPPAPQLDPEPRASRPVFVTPTRDPRERFVRFTRKPTSVIVPPTINRSPKRL